VLNRLTILLALLTVTLDSSVGLVSTASADDLRVMSFNIRYGTANDGDDAWPKRQELVLKVIEAAQPDLLGTQETLPFQASYLAEHMPDFQYFGWSRDASPNGEQCGIFIRKSRFEVLESGQFWLSETPESRHVGSPERQKVRRS
jgi:endonuclease/exonuclease/phosphatase family metal-dependent hydrolase